MKLTTTIVAFAVAGTTFGQQAEIVNGFDGFETWVNAEVGELPQYWDGFNKNVEFNGTVVGTVECVSKNATDPYEGLFSAQLTSTSIMGGPAVPGIMTVGDFMVDWTAQDGDVVGGETYTQMPMELNGQFKYSPNGVDTGFVSVWFLENGVEVGGGRFEFTESTGGWNSFTVSINYDQGAAPDSMNLMFSSSQSDPSAIPAGSVLEIDAIAFSAFVNLNELEGNGLQCTPNPTTDFISIALKTPIQGQLKVVSVSGEEVLSASMCGSTMDLDVSHLPSGSYLVTISGEASSYTEKIVIQ